MAAAVIGTVITNTKIQSLKNESKGQLGKNWKIEFHDVPVTGAGGTAVDFNITTEIQKPVFISGCQLGTIATPYIPPSGIADIGLSSTNGAATFGSNMVVSTAGVIAITLSGINTIGTTTYRIKIEGY